MKSFSIKLKLLLVVVSCLVLLGVSIALFSIMKSTDSLEKEGMNKLSAVEVTKSSEILTYFNSIRSLIISLANDKSTKDAFIKFEKGFYKLSEDISINLDDLRDLVKKDFSLNYLDKVNYDVPNSSKRKNIENYLAKNINGLIAQYIFITNNKEPLGEKNNLIFNPKYQSLYMDAHKEYHPVFNSFLNNFQLYDIFMVDMEGNLIYTDYKEKDYATNLKSGPYKNTGIGKVYEKALLKNKGEIAFEDFNPYEPSYNLAASFIATPIFIQGEKKGILIFQMPVDTINEIMSFKGKYKEAGLGESGECYLVGSDYMMRNNSRFLEDIKDKTVRKLKSTIGVWSVKTDSTKAVFENNKLSGKWIIDDYRGVSVLSTYRKLDIYDGEAKWAIVAEIDEDEALISARVMRNVIVIISLIAIFISLLIIFFFINKIILKPINNFKLGLLSFFKYINKETNEVKLLPILSGDEIGQMSDAINENIKKTQKIIESDNNFLEEVSDIVNDVNKGYLYKRLENSVDSENLEKLRQEINSMLKNLNSIVGGSTNKILNVLDSFAKLDFTNSIKDDNAKIPTSLNNVAQLITNMLIENKANGLTLNNSAVALMSNVETLSTSSNQAASSLEETAAALEEITSTIITNTDNVIQMSQYAKELNKSSNLGQNLANETTISMDEIDEEVNAINEAITVIDQIAFQTNILSLNAAVEAATAGEAGKGFTVVAQEVRNLATRSAEAAKEIKEIVENATKKANEGKVIANKMIEGYEGLNQNIIKTSELINLVELASKEQQQGIEQINNAVSELDQQTQQNAQVASQTANIANITQTIAETIVKSADEKTFHGKENVQAKQIDNA